MNNAKRVLTFALAVCSLSAFASCGSSSDSSSKVVDKKLKEDQQQIVERCERSQEQRNKVVFTLGYQPY